MSPRWYSIAALALLAFLLASNIYRARSQSITIDEAFTYSSFLATKHFWLFDGAVANNHVLYTLLCKLSIVLFGLSELTLRLPSLAGGLLYFIGLFRLSRFLFGRSVWFLLSVALNSLNPLILDYLSAARGYGLGLAFFTWGLYYWLRHLADTPDDRALAIKAGAAWGLAAAAQLTYIPPAAAVAGVSILFARNWRSSVTLVATATAVACAFLAWPMRHATRADFYIGLSSLEQTVTSLAETSLLYKQPLPIFSSMPLLRVVFVDSFKPLLAAAAIVIGLLCLRRGRPQIALRVIVGASVVWFLALRAAVALNARQFPPNRAGLYIFLFTSLACLLSLQSLQRYRIVTVGGALILSVYVGLYALQYSVGYYVLHQPDTGVRNIFNKISERRSGGGVQVGASWLLQDDLNFYRAMYHADWMEPVVRDGPDCYFDYYVLLPEDAPFAARYHLDETYRETFSGVALAKPSGSVVHPTSGPPPCGIDTRKLTDYASLAEPGAKAHVARGMVDGADLWTFNRVVLFFRVEKRENVKFKLRFDVNPAVFSHTGPVTVWVSVNGRRLGQATYDSTGEHTFEQPVPVEWFGGESLAAVDVRMDKYYLSPLDGAKLGLWLYEAGFVH